MKFKYYLRGLGMGILFATVIMMVSGMIHNNNLSDEEIMKRAEKLGMVMAESESDTGLFSGKGDSESESVSEPESDKEPESDSESHTEPSEEPEPSESESTSDSESESNSESESTSEGESQNPPPVVERNQVVFYVYNGDTPKKVSRRLEELGVIDDAAAFRKYIDDNGYSGRLRVGEYVITIGADYEEIAKIITRN